MTSEPKLHIILCEGYDDRSFWAGWLEYLGCADPSEKGRKWAAVEALVAD